MVAIAPERIEAAEVAELPPSFQCLGSDLKQMPAGAPGKAGVLALHFERRGERTRLVHQYSTGPQRVIRALYLDEALVDMAFVFIQSVGGGILQGDRLGIDISVGPGARAHVTTQSAVKVYRMEADYATQRVQVSVGPGGYLELISDYLIPYRGARFYNEVDLSVATGATMLYADAIAPGRVAFGESYAYKLLHTRLLAHYPGGGLRAADTTVLEPLRVPPRSPGLLGGYSDLGSMLVLSDSPSGPELAAHMRDALQDAPDAWGGASALAHGDGAFLRVLGPSSTAVQTALHCGWRAARQLLAGTGVPKVHRLKYGFDIDAANSQRRGERTTSDARPGSLPCVLPLNSGGRKHSAPTRPERPTLTEHPEPGRQAGSTPPSGS